MVAPATICVIYSLSAPRLLRTAGVLSFKVAHYPSLTILGVMLKKLVITVRCIRGDQDSVLRRSFCPEVASLSDYDFVTGLSSYV